MHRPTKDSIRSIKDRYKNGMEQTVGYKKPPLPVDHGWAWLVMLGVFVNLSLLLIFVRATGLIILEFLDLYQESAAVTTMAFGLSSATFAVFSFLGPTVLMRRFEVRTMAVAGTALNALCILAMAFAPNIIFINLILILFGLSHSLVLVPQMTLVGFYFKKWLAFATSFVNLGLSVATMGAAPLTQYLLDGYGLQGALMILSAVNMNCVAASLLLRPVSMYSASSNVGARPSVGGKHDKPYVSEDLKHTEEVTVLTSSMNSEEIHIQKDVSQTVLLGKDSVGFYKAENEARVKGQTQLQVLKDDVVNGSFQISPANQKSENGDPNDVPVAALVNSKNSSFSSLNDYSKEIGSFQDNRKLNIVHKLTLDHNHDIKKYENINGEALILDGSSTGETLNTDTTQTEIGSANFIPENNLETRFFFRRFTKSVSRSIYTHPVGILLVITAGIGVHTPTIVAYMPAMGRENGVATQQIPFLVTVIGACDMLSKFVIGFVADLRIVRPVHLACLGQLVTGLAVQFIRFYHGLGLMVTLQVLIGLSSGILHVMLPVITVEKLGPKHLGHIFSGYFMVSGVMATLDHVLSGVVKDVTGSFLGLYNFMGCLNLVSSVLLLLLPLVARLPRARKFKM